MSGVLHVITNELKRARHIKGFKEQVEMIAVSPDGNTVAMVSDKSVKLWRLNSNGKVEKLSGHTEQIMNIAWKPGTELLATCSKDYTIRIWDTATLTEARKFDRHEDYVFDLTWLPDGNIASISLDNTIRFWDSASGRLTLTVEGDTTSIEFSAWSPDAKTILCGSSHWVDIVKTDTASGIRLQQTSGIVLCAAWHPDGKTIALGLKNATIQIWDVESVQQTRTLEGQSGPIAHIAYSPDGQYLFATTLQGKVFIWRCDIWEMASALTDWEISAENGSISFYPSSSNLAVLSREGFEVEIWKWRPTKLPIDNASIKSVHYTNAKVVLLGNSAVGKTALGQALVDLPFAATSSTHGRHIWLFDSQQRRLDRERQEELEILLWDLAGQPGYRLIHQLHLNETALALVVFDAQSETDPFAGVSHWARALRHAESLQGPGFPPIKRFLISARIDCGAVSANKERIESFMREFGFNHYYQTSSKEGWGIQDLQEAIQGAIDWNSMPKVSSTKLFWDIKKFIIKEKEEGCILSSFGDLYRSYTRKLRSANRPRDLKDQFSICLSLVESKGLIKRLGFGNLVLLQPELLDNYASAIVNAAKEEPHGLGCIPEEVVQRAQFRISKSDRIADEAQEKLLLIATIEDMLRHEIALRETEEEGSLLVFPSQYTREWPEAPDPQGKTLIISFEGPVVNIYTTLVVRLSHSRVFKRNQIWKNAAIFSAQAGGQCGIYLREAGDGQGEIITFFDPAASSETRAQFEEYVFAHLQRRSLKEGLSKQRIVSCSECGTTLTAIQVSRRLERGFDWIDCNVCDQRISLKGRQVEIGHRSLSVIREMDRAADQQRDYNAGLVSATGEFQSLDLKNWAGSLRSTVALVFTDIVGSTALANEVGNELMKGIRASHFGEAKRRIRQLEGYQVKTIGDAFMAAFRTADDALNFALMLSRETGDPRVKIRAGIHVGPIDIEEGDAFGSMVNYTDRVTGMAKDAEIWLSDRAKGDIDEIKSRRHQHLRWKEMPNCNLKGFPGDYTLWQLSD